MFISYWKYLVLFSLCWKYGCLVPVEGDEKPAENAPDDNTQNETPASEKNPDDTADTANIPDTADAANVTEASNANNATQTAVLTLEPDATTPENVFTDRYCLCLTRGPLPRFKLIGNIHFPKIKVTPPRYVTPPTEETSTLCPPCICPMSGNMQIEDFD